MLYLGGDEKMEKSFIIAGFGGQGVMLIGQLLGYSASYCGKNASYYPSYGPEQRGGTANCTVVISDDEIGSPIIQKADVVLVMNEPSLNKFEPVAKSGGVIIINSSLIQSKVKRDDVETVYIPVNEIAQGIGSTKVANMIMLGVCIGKTHILPEKSVFSAIEMKMKKHPDMLDMNFKAVKAGEKFKSA